MQKHIFSKPISELKSSVRTKYTYFNTLKYKKEDDDRIQKSLELDKQIEDKLTRIKELENKEIKTQKRLDNLVNKLTTQINEELNG